MKKKLIESFTKKQLRIIVGQVITISDSKLNKMNREKCVEAIEHLSYNQLIELDK